MNKSILIFACIFSMCVKPPEYVSVSDKTIETYAQTIAEPKLKVLAVGGFYLREKVERLYLDLDYMGVLSVDSACARLRQYAAGMIAAINDDVELKPFLIKETFDIDDISLSLAYLSEDEKSVQLHVENGELVLSTYVKTANTLKKEKVFPYAE